MSQTKKPAFALLVALGVIVALLAYFLLTPSQPDFNALKKQVSPSVSLYPGPKSLAGEYLLLDDQRNTLKLSDLVKDRWTMLYFGYASCPDVCPVDLAMLNQTLALMQQPEKLQVLFISVDPKRDIGNLSSFAKRFNKDFIGLSATPENLQKITEKLGIYHEVSTIQAKANQDHSKMDHSKMGGAYLVNHTASYLLLNSEAELIGLLTNPHRPEKMAPALDLIIKTLK
ncbi:SCO family protein [Candidatus Thioglobus sp.]|uniref:SCO family protein n=1 Tax=Candidatus Thioglobus sp. TaxID=2026721 RepID=UPI003D1388B1